MAAEKPLASIIMPCWNSGRYIRESVASALAQTYPNIELVISDDEETQAILDGLHDSRIRVLHFPHRGASAARNAAIAAAEGTYILPLDSDDLIEPSYLAEAIAILAQDADVGMVYARADYFDARQGPWEIPDFNLNGMLLDNRIFVSAVFRKLDFQRVGGYDTTLSFYEDWDFWLSFLERGLRPVRLDKVYFHYRQRQDDSSTSQQDTSRENFLQCLDKIVAKHEALYRSHVRGVVDHLRHEKLHYRMEMRQWQAIAGTRWDWRAYEQENRWTRMAAQMPWAELEKRYQGVFPELTGTEAPVRLAVGMILLQTQLGCSDEEVLHQLEENPYMREFVGLFDDKPHFPPGFMAYRHGKITAQMLQEIAQLLQGGEAGK